MVDSHAHIYLPIFENDLEQVIQRAKDKGIQKILMPNLNTHSISSMLWVEKRFPICSSMIGLHPCYVNQGFEKELSDMKPYLSKKSFVAIGEIGIDLYHDTTYLDEQKQAFEEQLQWAKEYQLPVVIHQRSSFDEMIEVIERKQDGSLSGVFHSFTGTLEEAQRVIELGFYIGIGGIITFKKNNLDTFLKKIPIENIVIETDAPYLTPSPFRGKRNEPAFLDYIVTKLAEIYDLNKKEVIEKTTENTYKLFSFDV